MLAYEKGLFTAWSATVEGAIASGMQQPILCRRTPASAGQGESTAGAGGSQPATVAAAAAAPSAALPPAAVNFPPGLLCLMHEARCLDQLGMAVPQPAVNLALQEGQLKCVCWCE